jgi:hypothetical protein
MSAQSFIPISVTRRNNEAKYRDVTQYLSLIIYHGQQAISKSYYILINGITQYKKIENTGLTILKIRRVDVYNNNVVK